MLAESSRHHTVLLVLFLRNADAGAVQKKCSDSIIHTR